MQCFAAVSVRQQQGIARNRNLGRRLLPAASNTSASEAAAAAEAAARATTDVQAVKGREGNYANCYTRTPSGGKHICAFVCVCATAWMMAIRLAV